MVSDIVGIWFCQYEVFWQGSWSNTHLPFHQTQNPSSSEKYTVLCAFKSHCSRESKLEKRILHSSELLTASATGKKMHAVLPRSGEQGCHHQLPMQSFTVVFSSSSFWPEDQLSHSCHLCLGLVMQIPVPVSPPPPSPHLLSCASAETDVLSQGQVLCLHELRVWVWCLGSLKEMEIPSRQGHKHSSLC